EALGGGLDAVEAAQEIDVPPVAPKLAVRDGLKPDRFLEGDGPADRPILDGAQRGAIDLAAGSARPSFSQLGRSKQAPHVVGPERRARRSAGPADTRADRTS